MAARINLPIALSKLIRRVQVRASLLGAIKKLPPALWVLAIAIAVMLPLHFVLQAVDAVSIAIAAVAIIALWFMRTAVVSAPRRHRAARIADTWFDSKSLISTTVSLADQQADAPFARLVLQQAAYRAPTWLAQPGRMPPLHVTWRAWLPAGIAATGLLFLLIPGRNAPSAATTRAATTNTVTTTPGSRDAIPDQQSNTNRAAANASRGDSGGPSAVAGLQPVQLAEPPPVAMLETAGDAPDNISDSPSTKIVGTGEEPDPLTGPHSDDGVEDTAIDMSIPALPWSIEIEIGMPGQPSTDGATDFVSDFSVQYGPAYARYAAAYFQELNRQGRNDE